MRRTTVKLSYSSELSKLKQSWSVILPDQDKTTKMIWHTRVDKQTDLDRQASNGGNSMNYGLKTEASIIN